MLANVAIAQTPSNFYAQNTAEVEPSDAGPDVEQIAPSQYSQQPATSPVPDVNGRQASDGEAMSVPSKQPNKLRTETATAKRTAIEKTHAPVLRRETSTDADGHQPDQTGVTEAAEKLLKPPVGAENVSELPTSEVFDELRKEIEENQALDEKARTTLTSVVRQAQDGLKTTTELLAKAKAMLAKTQAVPRQVDELKETLRQTPAEPELPDLNGMNVREVEATLQDIRDQLTLQRQRIQADQKRNEELHAVRKTSQQRLQEIATKRSEVHDQLGADPAGDVSPLQRKIQIAEWKTCLAMLDAREQLIKAESKFARSMTGLQPLQNDLDVRTIARIEALRNHYAEALDKKQQEELQRGIEEARKKAQLTDPDLHSLAEHNLQLAELLSKYHDQHSAARDELDRITLQFDEQEESFLSIQKKVQKIGMTEAIGILLRAQYRDLIDDRPLRTRAEQIDKELPHVELTRITAKEERDEMAEMQVLIEEYSARVAQRLPQAEADRMVRELLEARRDYLDELGTVLSGYEETLADLHATLKNTAKVTKNHHRYVDEHVLWTRSSSPITLADIRHSHMGLGVLFEPSNWTRVVTDLGMAIQRRQILSLTGFAALVIVLVLIDRLKDRVTAIGEQKSVEADFRFAPTAEAATETLILACVFPGVCLIFSWFIGQSTGVSDLTIAIGIGLKWISMTWFALALLQQVVRPGGLAEKHFRWHHNNLRVVRKNLQLLLLFGLPAVFLVTVIESFEEGKWDSSLGRLSFIAGMLIMTLFMHRLLTPYRTSGGIWAKRELWLFKVRHVLHGFCVLLPSSFAILAAIGYGYSAHQLAYRAHLSLWLAIIVILSYFMIARYFRIARRNAAVRHMRRKRAESEEADSDITVEDELDFQEIGDQLKQLLRGTAAVVSLLGLSLIWADMVPALKMLDDKQLWATTQMVTENVEQEDGTIQVHSAQKTVPVTLADLLLCLMTITGTIMAARNLPGLLNVTIFERLPIDYGTRYAMTAVSRYLISLIGIVAAFQMIGVTWSSVQWLVAAMTVGLGFGLQEIFANFVSGLIILMERPIRVGDFVTVGGVMGKVTRVQIRATTITDMDRRELVVPNRRFITEDVINWTLSDPITRLVLPVGIAYECDPQLARERLLEVAAQHPLVLSEPEPTAVFMGFGDSTLDLELRTFIMGRDQVFEVRDQLNLAINQSFKDAGLEIAFPQRDLHIRSMDANASAAMLANLLAEEGRDAKLVVDRERSEFPRESKSKGNEAA